MPTQLVLGRGVPAVGLVAVDLEEMKGGRLGARQGTTAASPGRSQERSRSVKFIATSFAGGCAHIFYLCHRGLLCWRILFKARIHQQLSAGTDAPEEPEPWDSTYYRFEGNVSEWRHYNGDPDSLRSLDKEAFPPGEAIIERPPEWIAQQMGIDRREPGCPTKPCNSFAGV